ncbi:MAG: chaperone modulator CbpM [Dysgonomonas sp.]
MQQELIIISEYCEKTDIEPQFISRLEEEGLIEIHSSDGKQYLDISQLGDIERYAHLYYELSINIEGIDVIRLLLERIQEMKSEIARLRRIMEPRQSDDFLNFDNDLFN